MESLKRVVINEVGEVIRVLLYRILKARMRYMYFILM